MKVCAACGVENPDIARFCLACGTQLAEARPPQETRKVVTIVFSDLKGSTSLGEALDSEALREVMTRYFDAMRDELERHGGVIEKFIGDAVMAVFGLPRLHEDDALRAVRAAAGMQAALERTQRRAAARLRRAAGQPHGRQHGRGRRGRSVDAASDSSPATPSTWPRVSSRRRASGRCSSAS